MLKHLLHLLGRGSVYFLHTKSIQNEWGAIDTPIFIQASTESTRTLVDLFWFVLLVRIYTTIRCKGL